MEITAPAYWINSTFAGFDLGITTAVHQLYDAAGWLFTPFFEFISLLGKGGIFLILLSFALMFFKRTRRFGTAMLLGVSIGAIFTNLFLKVVIARPRPYADASSLYHQLWLTVGQNVESDHSFPSGHTNAAFATMIPLFILGKKRWSWVALAFAILMGVSRIYLCVHYPTDVIGGAITGTLGGILGVLIASRLPKKWYEWDLLRRKGRHENVRAR